MDRARRRTDARLWWQIVESIHAVTYFAPECIDANKQLGLRGFWMGYFASRAAPLGAVGPAVVEATFFNFHPAMVRRAIPDAWTYASPDAIVVERRRAAAAALRRISRNVTNADNALVFADDLFRIVDAAAGAGRPLFAANRDLARPDDPVEALWQACTCLREHRGDGHVAALVAAGLDGCEAHVLAAAASGVPAGVLRDNRGWSIEEWTAATERLEARGLVAGTTTTEAGSARRQSIEDLTDDLAAAAWTTLEASLPTTDFALDVWGLGTIADEVLAADLIPFPNPMGLPRLDGAEIR